MAKAVKMCYTSQVFQKVRSQMKVDDYLQLILPHKLFGRNIWKERGK